MAAPKKYKATRDGVLGWAKSELEHVGRIAGIEDKDIQYSYALSTVNGMAHLRDALYELIHDKAYHCKNEELLRTHNTVIRVMNHLIQEYNVNLDTIRKFNTRHVLSNAIFKNSRKNKASSKKTRRSPH